MEAIDVERLAALVSELEGIDPAESPDPAAKLVETLSALLDAEDDDPPI
jgi:hypothetical protein